MDDDARDGKRIESLRLPAADNQGAVRFRLAYAGTDSWYWGIDNFGLYSVAASAGLGVEATAQLGTAFVAEPGAVVDAGLKIVTISLGSDSRFFRVTGGARIKGTSVIGGKLVLQLE